MPISRDQRAGRGRLGGVVSCCLLACATALSCVPAIAAESDSNQAASVIVAPLEHNRELDGGLFWSDYRDTLTGRFDLDGTTYYVSMTGYHSGNGFLTGLFASKETKTKENAIEVSSLTISPEETPACPVYGPIPNRLQLGKRLFDATLDTNEKTLRLTPSTEQTFPIKLTITPEQIVLKSLDGKNIFSTAVRPGDTLLLPNGRYRLQDYDVVRPGEKKTFWVLTGEGGKDGPNLEVAGGPTEFKLGEPYVPRIDISDSQREAVRQGVSEIRVGFVAQGAGGERASGVTSFTASGEKPWSRSNRPAPPSYKLIKPDGEVVAAGRFEYG